MLINLVTYDKKSNKKVIRDTRSYFKDNENVRSYDDVIWLSNMYVKFGDKMISLNIFNTKTDWRPEVKEYIEKVFANEKVFIKNGNKSEYYETFKEVSSDMLE